MQGHGNLPHSFIRHYVIICSTDIEHCFNYGHNHRFLTCLNFSLFTISNDKTAHSKSVQTDASLGHNETAGMKSLIALELLLLG